MLLPRRFRICILLLLAALAIICRTTVVGSEEVVEEEEVGSRSGSKSMMIITTIVGSGSVGSQLGTYSGDGGPAIIAEINNPEDVDVDALTGSIFIADKVNNRIRKVTFDTFPISSSSSSSSSSSLSPPQIVTVAGNGEAKFSGDGGRATDASLFFPCGVSVYRNSDGDSATLEDHAILLIADSWNNRIRTVNLHSGIISTLAGSGADDEYYSGDGGLAELAALNNPVAAIAAYVGPRGRSGENKKYNSVLIVDSFNHRIRRVGLEDGIISTIAGMGMPGSSGDGLVATSATLNRPYGIALDSSQRHAFIADFFGNRIRKLNLDNGIISTIAGGNGKYGFAGDGEDALSVTMYNPQKIALDCHDNIYFTDYYNHKIRMIDAATNLVSTIAGSVDSDSKKSGFSGDGSLSVQSKLDAPMGLAFDKYNNLFIADSNNHRIRKVTPVVSLCTTRQDEL